MNKIPSDTILSYLEKLDKSPTFAGSERNMGILRFLVDSYIKGIHVKETVLAIELFEDKAQAVSYDGKVRVYMYNLRKKLDDYYRNEGAGDAIIFSISKGQYNLSVEKRSKEIAVRKRKRFPVIVSLLMIIMFLTFLLFRSSFDPEYCWASFFDKSSETLCCVGDHFTVVSKSPTGRRLSSYVGGINSDSDFKKYLEEHNFSSEEMIKAPFSFSTKMGPVCSAKLGEWFALHKSSFDVVMESELSVENINDNSIVYIGPFKTMDVLSELFLKGSTEFKYDGQYILDGASNTKIRDVHVNNSREDHVMVSFNSLTDTGKDILFFAANNDIGVLAAVKNFTNKDWLRAFYKNIPNKDAYFNALFKVEGIGRTELQCELVKIEVLD